MPAESPTSLLHYDIIESLGVGGMGEVYRARDTKLGRHVAIKVLPPEFANDPERLARFEREARALAAINHPNIATIFGLEEDGGTRFLVLELVPGETLEVHLRERKFPIREALKVCREIAVALEVAHERGIVHRDLKPSNVKILPDGTVKVLDFGLAKTVPTHGMAAPATSDTKSPTRLIEPTVTSAGAILGTAHYMSPEGAQGKEVDKRADIWSFGCILFEMLCARRAFEGPSFSDVVAAILKEEPDYGALSVGTPANIPVLLRRCLEKDRNQRLHDIADARIELDEAIRGAVPAMGGMTTTAATFGGVGFWGAAIAATAIFAVGLLAGGVFGPFFGGTGPAYPTRVAMGLPPELWLYMDFPSLTIAPDGRRMAFVVATPTSQEIFLLEFDEIAPRRLPGTEGAMYPFFSTDSRWIGYFDGESRELKRLSVTGGDPSVVTDADFVAGASWGPDDTIVFSSESGLMSVAAEGGAPRTITNLDDGALEHGWPHVLPDGEHVLFSIFRGGSYDEATIAMASLADGTVQTVWEGGYFPHFSDRGHLIFAQGDSLFSAPFDPRNPQIDDSPIAVTNAARTDPVVGFADFAFSRTGTLAYVSHGSGDRRYRLVRATRNGDLEPLGDDTGIYGAMDISPDGRKLAMMVNEGDLDIWVYDLARVNPSRLTFEPTWEGYPIWSRDGERIVFTSERTGVWDLFERQADGSGDARLLVESPNPKFAGSWSADGTELAYYEERPDTGFDLLIHSTDSPDVPQVFLATDFDEQSPHFSPDGRWIAYQSNESGGWEVYVRPYPAANPRIKVSTGGGYSPRWGAAGGEIFYFIGGALMRVGFDAAGGAAVGSPEEILAGNYRPSFDVSADGDWFVLQQWSNDGAGAPRVNLVFDWFAELEAIFEPSR